MVLKQDKIQGCLELSTKHLEPTPGDMLTNPQLVYEKAKEMAERYMKEYAIARQQVKGFTCCNLGRI